MPYQNEVQAPSGAGSKYFADANATSAADSDKADSSCRGSSTASDGIDSTDNQNQSVTHDIGLTSGNLSETLECLKQISGQSRNSIGLTHLSIEGLSEDIEDGFPKPAPGTEVRPPMPADGGNEAPQVRPPAPVPAPFFEAYPSTEIPYVRQQLNKAKIDPSQTNGIKIGIIENEFKTPGSHGSHVEAVINDREFGMIPGSKQIRITRDSVPDAKLLDHIGKTDGLDNFIVDLGVSKMTGTSTQLEKIMAQKDPSLRVLNMSYAMENVIITQKTLSQITKNPKECRGILTELIGAKNAQKFIDSAGGGVKNQTLNNELTKAVLKRVDSVVENSSKISDAKEKYRAITKQAAKQGITICVGVGNSEDDFDSIPGIDLKPGDANNWYAQSDHVIAVGATNTQETVGKRDDDTVTKFSARGDGKYNPTVVIQGQMLQISDHPKETAVTGTSFSTPQVAATVAIMLAQNPKMKFDEIKTTLQNNTIKIADTPSTAQGAGILLPEKAIITAKDSAKKAS